MSKQYTQNNEESVAVIDGFQDLLNNYVQKDGSKVLSTNDYTTAEKNKLAGIAANANNFTYTLPTATSSVLGGVKVGSNITNSNGTISLSSANVTSALGYTPAQSATDLSSYMPKSGGTFTGAVTFANHTWNTVGDDVAIGDHDVSGALAIVGLNGATRLDFCQYGKNTNYKSITFDGTTLYLNGTATLAESATTASKVTTSLTGSNVADIIYTPIADNDYFRIRVGGTAANSGFAELATADDGNEPIYVRQYSGTFTTLTRTATLLDSSGNTSFPGILSAGGLILNTTARTNEGAIWVEWS